MRLYEPYFGDMTLKIRETFDLLLKLINNKPLQ